MRARNGGPACVTSGGRKQKSFLSRLPGTLLQTERERDRESESQTETETETETDTLTASHAPPNPPTARPNPRRVPAQRMQCPPQALSARPLSPRREWLLSATRARARTHISLNHTTFDPILFLPSQLHPCALRGRERQREAESGPYLQLVPFAFDALRRPFRHAMLPGRVGERKRC
jgi:hypothetical protein